MRQLVGAAQFAAAAPGTRHGVGEDLVPAVDVGTIDVNRVRVEALVGAWADAERDASGALAAWRAARGGDRSGAYLAYRAAADRERQAAVVVAAAVEARR